MGAPYIYDISRLRVNTDVKNSWRFTSCLPRVITTSCWRTRTVLPLHPKTQERKWVPHKALTS